MFQSERIMLPGDKKMRSLNIDENENYNYLGVLEENDIKHSDLKARIQKEYFRRVNAILKSKLKGGNTIKAAINSSAVFPL